MFILYLINFSTYNRRNIRSNVGKRDIINNNNNNSIANNDLLITSEVSVKFLIMKTDTNVIVVTKIDKI